MGRLMQIFADILTGIGFLFLLPLWLFLWLIGGMKGGWK